MKKIYFHLLPRTCAFCQLACGNQSLDLCGYCKHYLPWFRSGCYQCGIELKYPQESIKCQTCLDSSPAFDRLCALFAYQLPITKLINNLKYGPNLYAAHLFGSLMAEKIKQEWYIDKELPQAIIPVPLHKKRQKQRGYNQSLEISKPISKLCNIPICTDIVARTIYNSPQSSLTRKQRLRNLSESFNLLKIREYEHVAIVDDVVTTGSTIRALSKVLNEAGIEKIDIWCVARA